MRLTREQNWALMCQALDEWREKTKVVPLDVAFKVARQAQWRREYIEILARHGIIVKE